MPRSMPPTIGCGAAKFGLLVANCQIQLIENALEDRAYSSSLVVFGVSWILISGGHPLRQKRKRPSRGVLRFWRRGWCGRTHWVRRIRRERIRTPKAAPSEARGEAQGCA